MPVQKNNYCLIPHFIIRLNLFIVLLTASLFCQAAIYKWVDQQGQIHYSDQPAPVGHQATKIKIRQHSTTQARLSKDVLEKQAIKQRKNEAKQKKQPTQQPGQVKNKIPASEKRQLCQQANSDLANIQSRGRMREINAKGEYVYLGEKQRQQRIVATKQKQRKYCH